MTPTTLLDKMWRTHTVKSLGHSRHLIHVDRHVVHEGSSPDAFQGLRRHGRRVRNPELTLGVMDHVVSTAPARNIATFGPGVGRLQELARNCRDFGIRLFDLDDRHQGIAHVVAPETGFVLPGLTVVCGDSHTATCGGLGALAWGIGTTELEQVLAGQCLVMAKPRALLVHARGHLKPGVHAKDLILHLIGTHGISFATGYAIEYAGTAVSALSPEGRMTVCNMSAEFGARYGFVAPDDSVFDYLHGRMFVPRGAQWDHALHQWRGLRSDPGAPFDRTIEVDCDTLVPQISWGTTPQAVLGIDGLVPDPERPPPLETRQSVDSALRYMDLRPGQSLQGLPIDVAFIGSCTNSRLSDLQAAARVAEGRRVAPGVRALVVPGSLQVKRAAEEMGLDEVFRSAGFEWRNPGCSMCVAANEDVVPPGARCISTSNRNFANRQGPGSRTHLASPAMVAAAAVTGHITDVRALEGITP